MASAQAKTTRQVIPRLTSSTPKPCYPDGQAAHALRTLTEHDGSVCSSRAIGRCLTRRACVACRGRRHCVPRSGHWGCRCWRGTGWRPAQRRGVAGDEFWRRFASARAFMGFAGLIPAEYSSGSAAAGATHHQGRPEGVRTALVEAAWAYRYQPAIGATLRRRQAGLEPETLARSSQVIQIRPRPGTCCSGHRCALARMSAWTDSRVPVASETAMRRAAGDSMQARRRRPPSR